ncbi:hypothetical protein P5P86_05420 [Nocardioides sp. BP30]|uniref:hypothetical protein n=1 Tax=Nocardioides sp. BP30 TaxID=3036374 RepID=UPI0024692C56|nr:hypothetical protein [Nocardioides sp. BP30]WGL53265.1 hypothetical protein P5P86_05420 [Nocardioides sp. BP30]
MSGTDDLLLPEGSRIVHIGPHKTGTTAIQGAFADARARLGEYGVHYPGDQWQVYRPALALTGTAGHRGTGAVDPEAWPRLVREIERYGEDRVLISSESFSRAEPDRIARLRDDLGPERVQIVRMIRRYDTLLPSLWQQRIVDGYDRHWQRYVGRPLNAPEGQFWERFGFATITRRWAEVVGPERVTVVVVNERDQGWLLRVMERLVGLPEGFLRVGDDPRYRNRSLSWAEAEMVRHLNLAFNERGWSDTALRHYVRFGLKVALKPFPTDPAEGKPRVSPARYGQVEELTRQHWADLHSLGVRVVGELDWLLPPRNGQAVGEGRGTAADPSSEGPLLLGAAKVVAAATSVVERGALRDAPSLGDDAVVLAAPRAAASPAAPAVDRDAGAAPPPSSRRWWRRGPSAEAPRVTVVPPLDQALAAWQERLAAGDAVELTDVLSAVRIELPPAGPVEIRAGTVRPYEELAVLRQVVTLRPEVAGSALAWLDGESPEPTRAVPQEVAQWARARAEELRAALAGREVRGDLGLLEPPDGTDQLIEAASAGRLLAGLVAASQSLRKRT